MIANKNTIGKEIKNNILALGVEARLAKEKDSNVINGTVGMLMDEQGKLYPFKSVLEAKKELSNEEQFAYSNISGNPNFSLAVKKWIFGSYLEEVAKDNYLSVIPTPGGSGALSLIFENYVEKGDTVLFPNKMWENYLVYAGDIGFQADCYSLFNGNDFNFDSIKLKVDYLKQKQNKITIVLNDPCQNPTGFCMKDSDYDLLIDLVNQNPLTNFVIVMDVAYFDFYNQDPDIIRARYTKLTKLQENAITFFCFSGSKSFGLYGLRIGALLSMTKDELEDKTFFKSACYSCRSRWSSATTYGMSLVTKLVLEDKYKQMFKDEVKEVCAMLERRSQAFLASAKEVGLEYYPYEKGFFVCVPYKDPERLMKELYQDKVRVINTKDAIRIAICSINEQEAKVLPLIIKGRMDLID